MTCFIISWLFFETSGEINSSTERFGVIIDCSNFTTSVNIFVWKSALVNQDLLNNINFLKYKDGGPVIQQIPQNLFNLMGDSSKERGYVRSIVEFIRLNVPEESRKFMVVYLMGTSDLDHSTQQVLLERISFKIREKLDLFKIEVSIETKLNLGVYNWIAINSLSRRFIENVERKPIKPQTIAVVEMNHYDVQVTFHYKMGMDALIAGYLQKEPDTVYKTLENHHLELNISKRGRGGYPYTLISVLFSGLGIERARSSYIDYLIKSQLKTVEKHVKSSDKYKEKYPLIVQDPCLPNKIVEILHKPIRMLSTKDKTIGFTSTQEEDKFTLSIKGSGDYWKCKSYLRNLLRIAKSERLNCDTTDKYCSTSLIGTLFLPFEFYEVVGIFDFHDIANKLNFQGDYDRSEFVEKTKQYCMTPYKKLLEMYAKPFRDEDYVVVQNCFKALWIDTFLSYALQMPENFENFRTLGKIEGQTFEWTLGAMINKSLTIQV